MARLNGKIAIVTGGSRGMGEQTVRLFVREGARVLIADVLDGEGAALAEELGEAARYKRLDVSQEEDWSAALHVCRECFGAPDVLVNNAAINRFQAILEGDVADFRRILDVNLIGSYLGLRIIGAAMVARGSGSIINISSVDGLRGTNGYAAYSTSKWGVRGLTKVAAYEFGPRGVRVNSVHPGGVDTVMGNPAGASMEAMDAGFTMVPLQRMGRPHEVAAATLFLASDEASYVCGAELAVDGGWAAGFYNMTLSGAPGDEDYGRRSA